MPKNPERLRNIDWDSIVRAIWGSVLPHLAIWLRTRSAEISEGVLPERTRDIIASLVGIGAQIFEKEFKGVHFEILSDVFEQIATGIKAPIEEKIKAKPEERKIKYEWPKLEELEAIFQSQEINIKRDLLLKFSSPNLHENIKKLSDEEINDLINVLIILERARRDLATRGIQVSLISIWQTIRQLFDRISKVLGRGFRETAEFVRRYYPQLQREFHRLDNEMANLAQKIQEERASKRWRLI